MTSYIRHCNGIANDSYVRNFCSASLSLFSCLSMSLPVSLHLSLLVSLFVYFSWCIFVSLAHSLSLALSVHPLSLSVLVLCIYVSLSLSLSLSSSLFFLSPPLSLTLCFSIAFSTILAKHAVSILYTSVQLPLLIKTNLAEE